MRKKESDQSESLEKETIMRRYAIVAVLVILSAAILTSHTNASAAPRGFGINADIRPLPDGTYACSIAVSDLATGEMLAKPQMRVSSGQPASFRMVSPSGSGPKENLKLDVTIDGLQTTAEITLSTIGAGSESKLYEFRIHFDK